MNRNQKFLEKFSYIFNEKGLEEFFNYCRKNNLSPTGHFTKILGWNNRFNFIIFDGDSDSLISLVEQWQERRTRLISENKRTDVIDYSLFAIYGGDNENTKLIYKEFCINKTKKCVQNLEENPILRKVDLQSMIIKHGEIEGTRRYNEFIIKTKKKTKRCVEYWIEQGFSLEESKLEVSKAQATFSLKKCVEKYGKEIGTKIWKERQENWQKTLKSKSKEEIEEINKKKSTKWNYDLLWNSEIDVPGKFYIIELDNKYFKIGITRKELHQRYSVDVLDKVKFVYESTLNHAFQIEQLIKYKFFNNIISKENQIDNFGWTETLQDVSFDEIYKEFKKLKNAKIANKKFEKIKNNHDYLFE
nr:MAG: hypothetical protein [Caudoviricetes sp.]